MRLNLDCMRAIVLAIADNLVPDASGEVEPIPANDLPALVPGYSQNDVLYWTRQLMDSGIIIPGKRYIRDIMPSIKDLSILGYQFIDAVKTDSIWDKVKPKLINIASTALSALIQKAIEIAASF